MLTMMRKSSSLSRRQLATLPPSPYHITNGLDLTPNLDHHEIGDDHDHDEHEEGAWCIDRRVWKSGSSKFWKFRSLEIQKSKNLKIQKPENSKYQRHQCTIPIKDTPSTATTTPSTRQPKQK